MGPIDPEDILVFIGLMCLLGAVTKIALSIINRRRSVDTTSLEQQLSDMNKRLERLEQTTDATALEVERISEGQRFTTKLLAEKAPLQSE